MKAASLFCFIIIVLCWVADYPLSYLAGYQLHWSYLWHGMILFLISLFPLFALLIIWSATLIRQKEWVWTSVLVGTVVVVMVLQTVLPSKQEMMARGLRDSLLQEGSIDNLRNFAHDLVHGLPPSHEFIPQTFVARGDVSGLNKEQLQVYRELRDKYKFMHWDSDGGPSVLYSENEVDFFWKGTGFSRCGCSIGFHDNHAASSEQRAVVRLSDDIYVYAAP